MVEQQPGVELLTGPVEDVAPRLLGMRLRTLSKEGTAEVLLNEVEAYGGGSDPASHAFGGPTERNQSMFEDPGTLYVYRSYGVHWCANISTGADAAGQAVLLRGGMPTAGVPLMEHRRGRSEDLANGPGKLTQALAITGADDGINVLGGDRVQLLGGEATGRVVATRRVGITKAQERLWRFVLEI